MGHGNGVYDFILIVLIVENKIQILNLV